MTVNRLLSLPFAMMVACVVSVATSSRSLASPIRRTPPQPVSSTRTWGSTSSQADGPTATAAGRL